MNKMAMLDMLKVELAGDKLEAGLIDAVTQEERDAVIYEYIEKYKDEQNKVYVPDFQTGMEWFNTTQPLSLHKDLHGKIVILDFFTYCCINCMHILPDLEAIEDEYSVEDGVVIIGVHSAKFTNEKVSANILGAVLRYEISHPVVNDRDATLWKALQIQCWPTIVVVGPNGEVLLVLAGEGNREKLLDFTRIAVDYYKSSGTLSSHNITIELEKNKLSNKTLSFPGKICMDFTGDNLVISDSGHHRILIVSKEGVVKECIGGPNSGYNNGSFEEAKFHSPQGVICHGDYIYVADTDNHVIRQIDLNNELVTTVVGTGVLGEDKEGGAIGELQPICSPWDLELGCSPSSDHDDIIYIAMAGSHQIWLYFLEDADWLKSTHYKKGTCVRFAGSGNEENRNNSYPHKASFAQPSGISIAKEEHNCLFIADSESSSIRTVSLKDGATKCVVGGARDPMDLFSFGDVDGKGMDAKLQHPLGVVWNPKDEMVYVADSYNHKIKIVDPVKKTCSTLYGSGNSGNTGGDADCVEFNEPNGLCVDTRDDKLYVTDTNNHTIRIINLQNKQVSELKVVFVSEKSKTELDMDRKKRARLTPMSTPIDRQDTLYVCPGTCINIQLDIQLCHGLVLTPEAPTGWQILPNDDDLCNELFASVQKLRGKMPNINQQPMIKLQVPSTYCATTTSFKVECILYFCENTGKCHMKGIVFELPIRVGEKVDDKLTVNVTLHKDISLQ